VCVGVVRRSDEPDMKPIVRLPFRDAARDEDECRPNEDAEPTQAVDEPREPRPGDPDWML
jgi:hypothetical protein